MFLQREKELNELKNFLESTTATAAMIYGVRQIGKSSLILEAVKNSPNVLYFESLDSPIEENIFQLTRKASRQLGLPLLSSDDIISFFENLKLFNRSFIVILDEYQYLKRNFAKGNLDSYMQSVIDSLKGSGIKIILSGSYVSDMKELLEKDNPLFNRFQLILHLKEMDYFDASSFYPELSARDKIAFYSVFGGSPNALSLINSKKSLKENIKTLILGNNAPLKFYMEYVLFSELRKAQAANAVLDVIKNRKLRFSEIFDQLKGVEEKNLNRQLNILLNIDVIEKEKPINAKDDKRKTFYSISSNLVRFYYAYVFANSEEIKRLGPETFYNNYIAQSINTFISYRTESIARSYFSRKAQKGMLGDVLDIGTYWYDDKIRKTNGEFDCVLKRKDSYDIYEVKYLESKLSNKLIKEEIEQINRIEGINIGKIGFISISGFESKIDGIAQLSGEDLYAEL